MDRSLWTAERSVRELAAVRKALGLHKVHLMGHSWGGAVVADYDACGAELHVRQLSAIARYRPETGVPRPFCFVLWGDRDRSIPFEAHRVLATECGGALVPLENCGHLVHVDRPDAVVSWARRLEALNGLSSRPLSG